MSEEETKTSTETDSIGADDKPAATNDQLDVDHYIDGLKEEDVTYPSIKMGDLASSRSRHRENFAGGIPSRSIWRSLLRRQGQGKCTLRRGQVFRRRQSRWKNSANL